MKIGCLTFHDSSNYGSVLQAYALQQAVKLLGHDYRIINYSNLQKRRFDSLLLKNTEQSWKNYLYKLFTFPFNCAKKTKFINFSKRYLNVEKKRILELEDLNKMNDKFDYFICGSDQIWNAKMIRFDSAYFLSFVKDEQKKIAYAASFGCSEPDTEEKQFYASQINKFCKISVRERSAQQVVSQCSKKEAVLVLDPTLLLSPHNWLDFVNDVGIFPKPYILTYCLSHDQEMLKFTNKLQKETGLPVLEIAGGMLPFLKKSTRIIPDPRQFVKLFANASYVVTNSFHGTAFSTNLNRNLFVFINGTKKTSTNSRIADFLEMLGLESRLFCECPNGKIDLTLPDFYDTNKKICSMRSKSIEFLLLSMIS